MLCTTAVVAVCLAIHFRIKRHLRQEQIDARVRSVIDEVAESTTEQEKIS
jgi:hypothetical protein